MSVIVNVRNSSRHKRDEKLYDIEGKKTATDELPTFTGGMKCETSARSDVEQCNLGTHLLTITKNTQYLLGGLGLVVITGVDNMVHV